MSNYTREKHAEYMRKWRKKHKMSKTQKKKDNCRSYAQVYLKRGILKKKPCAFCDSLDVTMHHLNYNKPLNIVWLCRIHHQAVTNKLLEIHQK